MVIGASRIQIFGLTLTKKKPCVLFRSSMCNGTITEAPSEAESSITTEAGSSLEEELEAEDSPTSTKRQPNLDDSAVGQSDSSGLVTSLDGEHEDADEDVFDVTTGAPHDAGAPHDEVVNQGGADEVIKRNAIFSPSAGRRRSRQQSTSLMRHPIEDDNLKDFHEHRLCEGKDPFDISYNLYSMVVRFSSFCAVVQKTLKTSKNS